MAGHSHFANIMHKKARTDAKRGKAFSKVSTLIMAAVRQGGPKIEDNPRLQLAIEKARAANMPKDTIQRAIDRASGAGGTQDYVELTYEAYAPGGVAMLIETLTDNRNRTGGAVRAVFSKHNGNLGSTGSVSHMFSHIGEITYKAAAGTPDAVLDAAIEAGADDVQSDEMQHLILCPFDMLGTVAGALEAKLGEAESIKAVWRPTLTAPVEEDNAQTIMKMISALEDDDDVQNVFANFEVSEEILGKLTAA